MALFDQGNYRDPIGVRAAWEEELPDEPIYRILTVRGASAAVLAVEPVRSESAEVVAEVLSRKFEPGQLSGVRHVASDNPGPEMYARLRAVLPAFRFLSLDPMHICMLVEMTHWHKRTECSTW